MSAVVHLNAFRPVAVPPSDDRIVRIKELVGPEGRTGLSRATLYRMMASGNFPPAVSLGGRSVGWRNSAINAWIAQRGQGGGA